MTRLYNPPRPITVTLRDGTPAQLGSKRPRPVLEVCASWRVDDDWWRVPISRTYFKLRTETALIEVFRDDLSDEWFLERIHD